jgi:Integrase core domain
MKIVNQNLYMELPELADVGISEMTVTTGISRERNGWQGIKDPSDNRRLLIQYEAMSEKYKAMVVAKYGDVWAQARREVLKGLIEVKQEDVQFYKDNLPPKAPSLTPTLSKGEGDRWDKRQEVLLATCAGAIRLWNRLRTRDIKQLGWTFREDFLEDLLKLGAAEGWCKGNASPNPSKGGEQKTPTLHPRRWADKCKRFEERGLESLMSATIGNKRAAKVTTEVEAMVAVIYMLTKWGGERICKELQDWRNPLSPPKTEAVRGTADERVTEITRRWLYHNPELKEVAVMVAEMGETMPFLGKTTVKDMVTSPAFELKYGIGRNGYQNWRNDFDKIMRRRKPTQPNLHWSMDGTKYEEYYWCEKDKVEKRVYFFFVCDSFDRQIVGWNDSKTEDKQTVLRTIRRAVTARGVTPNVLQSDHGSAMINNEMTPIWEELVEAFIPAAVKNARTKPAECLLKDFHEQYATASVAYSGLGVKSKRERSHANQDKLNSTQKRAIGTYEEVVARMALYVEDWNKKHKKTIPETLKHAPRPITQMEIIDLLWSWRLRKDGSKETYQYSNNGLLLQHKTVNYEYEVCDDTGVFDVAFYTVNVGSSFYVKYDDDDMTRIALYHTKTQHLVAVAGEKRMHSMTYLDREGNDGARYALEMQRKKEVVEYAKNSAAEAYKSLPRSLTPTLSKGEGDAQKALPAPAKKVTAPKRKAIQAVSDDDYTPYIGYSDYTEEEDEYDYEAAVKNPFVGTKKVFKDDLNDNEDVYKQLPSSKKPVEKLGLYDAEADY